MPKRIDGNYLRDTHTRKILLKMTDAQAADLELIKRTLGVAKVRWLRQQITDTAAAIREAKP